MHKAKPSKNKYVPAMWMCCNTLVCLDTKHQYVLTAWLGGGTKTTWLGEGKTCQLCTVVDSGCLRAQGRKIKRAPAYHVLSIVEATKREF